jgi:hypothetical protein
VFHSAWNSYDKKCFFIFYFSLMPLFPLFLCLSFTFSWFYRTLSTCIHTCSGCRELTCLSPTLRKRISGGWRWACVCVSMLFLFLKLAVTQLICRIHMRLAIFSQYSCAFDMICFIEELILWIWTLF